MITRTIPVVLLLGLVGCTGTAPAEPVAPLDASGALGTARQLLDAFNAHDPEAMAALVDESFELYYITDGRSELSAGGREDLRTQMTEYFSSRPTVHSVIEGSIDGPRFVAFRERAGSRTETGERSASSLAVYEIVNDKVLRAWYYPAEASRGQ